MSSLQSLQVSTDNSAVYPKKADEKVSSNSLSHKHTHLKSSDEKKPTENVSWVSLKTLKAVGLLFLMIGGSFAFNAYKRYRDQEKVEARINSIKAQLQFGNDIAALKAAEGLFRFEDIAKLSLINQLKDVQGAYYWLGILHEELKESPPVEGYSPSDVSRVFIGRSLTPSLLSSEADRQDNSGLENFKRAIVKKASLYEPGKKIFENILFKTTFEKSHCDQITKATALIPSETFRDASYHILSTICDNPESLLEKTTNPYVKHAVAKQFIENKNFEDALPIVKSIDDTQEIDFYLLKSELVSTLLEAGDIEKALDLAKSIMRIEERLTTLVKIGKHSLAIAKTPEIYEQILLELKNDPVNFRNLIDHFIDIGNLDIALDMAKKIDNEVDRAAVLTKITEEATWVILETLVEENPELGLDFVIETFKADSQHNSFKNDLLTFVAERGKKLGFPFYEKLLQESNYYPPIAVIAVQHLLYSNEDCDISRLEKLNASEIEFLRVKDNIQLADIQSAINIVNKIHPDSGKKNLDDYHRDMALQSIALAFFKLNDFVGGIRVASGITDGEVVHGTRRQNIINNLLEIISKKVNSFKDISMPQRMALNWGLLSDPAYLNLQDEKLLNIFYWLVKVEHPGWKMRQFLELFNSPEIKQQAQATLKNYYRAAEIQL
jgi:hypothetical protein